MDGLSPRVDQNIMSLDPVEGYLQMEDEDANAFRRKYFILNRARNVLEYYREKPEGSSSNRRGQALGIIEIKYITNVTATSQRQMQNFCFEICTTAKKYFLAASNASEMQNWISTLHKAAVNPAKGSRSNSDTKSSSRSGSESSETITYQTKIVGGVVIKCPVQKIDGEADPSQSIGEKSCTPGLRLIKDGWCFKQGAVMKNWKRRYFTLNVLKLCYFEKEEESNPLKTILLQDVRGVRDVSGYCNRENVFEVDTPNRKFYVQTDTKGELKAWIAEITEIVRPSRSS